jgi:phage antirepressor YoqD-like protein
MNDLIKPDGNAITMTSLELVQFINNQRDVGEAELRHDDFMRKVPKVLGDEGVRKFADTYVHQQNGQTYPCYRFPKREACLMAMSYSYDLQAKVFDRMTKLEEGAKGHVSPANLSRMQLIEIAMQAEQERILLEGQVEEMTPKVQAFERIALSDGSLCLTDAAKTLQIQPKKLTQMLQEQHWIYRRPMGTGWLAYQERIQQGLLEHKVTTGEKSDGSEWTSTQPRITPKGLTKLAEAVRQAGLH